MGLAEIPVAFTVIFLTVCVLELLLLFLIFLKLPLHKPDCTKVAQPQPVSVVISAQNEAQNLQRNLPRILEQDHPDYEVVVVNDKSIDGTEEVLADMRQQYKHLQVVTVEEHVHEFEGKKLPLTLGIKRAKNDNLIFTDADCLPVSEQWLTLMQRHLPEKDIVLGFSPYTRRAGVTNFLIQYETFHTAFQYFSLALSGMPYMGVGRNLGYKRSLFFSGKGFARHLNVAAGDDDLFVNQHANRDNVAVELCPEAFVMSEPKRGLGNWLRQKRRHLNSGKFYKRSHRYLLWATWFINFLFYLSGILMAFFEFHSPVLLSALAITFITRAIILVLSLRKLNMLFMGGYVVVLDILFQLLIYPFLGLFMLFSRNPKKW